MYPKQGTGKLLIKYGQRELEGPLLSPQEHVPWHGVENCLGCLFHHSGMQGKTGLLGTSGGGVAQGGKGLLLSQLLLLHLACNPYRWIYLGWLETGTLQC